MIHRFVRFSWRFLTRVCVVGETRKFREPRVSRIAVDTAIGIGGYDSDRESRKMYGTETGVAFESFQ